MIANSPPPWAYDYSYNDSLTTVDSVPATQLIIEFPAHNDSYDDPYADQTTQTIGDSYPLDYGKHKGRTPLEVEKIDPGWIDWATKNVDKHRIVWSDELAARCAKKAAALPKLRR